MRPTHLIKIMMLVLVCLSAWAQQGDTRPGPDYFYTIQMASFKQESSARDAVKKLKQNNRDVFYRPIQIADKGNWYRLYINRYATIQAAQAGISKLRKLGVISDAYVRRLKDTSRIKPKSDPQTQIKEQPQVSVGPPVESSRNQKSEKMTRLGADATLHQADNLKIRDISVRFKDKEGDIAFVQADRYFWPITRLNHDGGKTQLLVQILNAGPFHKDISSQASGCKYMQNSQVVYDPEKNILVLSVDLPDAENYRITQVFNQAQNIFSLQLSK